MLSMSDRDDFPEKVKRALAERVGYRCSYPGCRALTTGPHSEPDKRVSVGVAAHITAASSRGARYCPDLTAKERASASNGIWMCSTHGTMVDRDEERYTVSKLRKWKEDAEAEADQALGKTVWPEDARERAEPEVTLIFSWDAYARGTGKPVPADGFSPPPFEVKNFGDWHASEVQVCDFGAGNLVARFALVADLSPGQTVARVPDVKDISTNSGPFFDYLSPKSIADLLEEADSQRQSRRLQEIANRQERMSKQEMEAAVEEMGERIEIEVRVTYWNREHTRQWEATERLCYEPHEHRAYVLHGSRREVSAA
jgi:hypothetical protein